MKGVLLKPSRECLLVSAGCIIRVTERKAGIFGPSLIRDARESLVELKSRRFATDIYVLLSSSQFLEHGQDWLKEMKFYNDCITDFDIVGNDRVIPFSESEFVDFVKRVEVTHFVCDCTDPFKLVADRDIQRYLFNGNGQNEPCVTAVDSWKDLVKGILS
jgi:hypothetical protein